MAQRVPGDLHTLTVSTAATSGCMVVMAYFLGPGAKMWKTSPAFSNRIESRVVLPSSIWCGSSCPRYLVCRSAEADTTYVTTSCPPSATVERIHRIG